MSKLWTSTQNPLGCRYNLERESFATVGKKTGSKKKCISVIWHEGIAGRKAEMLSAYVCALQRERELASFCPVNGQLHSSEQEPVPPGDGRTTLTPQDITLKYFKMRAHLHECWQFSSWCGAKDEEVPWGCCPYFQDFSTVIASSNSGKKWMWWNCKMRIYRHWEAGPSMKKLNNTPHLAEVAKIQFRRGLRTMWVKCYHHLQVGGLGGIRKQTS